MTRRSAGIGDRLTWCQDARPKDWTIRGRVVSRAVQKSVLWALTNRADADGSCFPFQATLAEEACVSRQSCNAALLALEEQGLLTSSIDPENRRSRRYVLNLSHSATGALETTDLTGSQGSDQQVSASSQVPEPDLSHSATDTRETTESSSTTAPVAQDDSDLSHRTTAIRTDQGTGQEPTSKSAPAAAGTAKTENQRLAEVLLDSSSSAQYLLRRLVEVDEAWSSITPASLIKLGRKYSAPVVITALGFMREEGRGEIDAYPYLESVCVRIRAEREAVPA